MQAAMNARAAPRKLALQVAPRVSQRQRQRKPGKEVSQQLATQATMPTLP